MEELNVKVGDKVLYKSGYYYNAKEKIVTVTRITPTGRIRVEGVDRQFDKYGCEMGNRDSWTPASSIRIPSEDDFKRIEGNNAIFKAVSLCERVNRKNLTYEQAVKIIEILEGEE